VRFPDDDRGSNAVCNPVGYG